MKVFSIVVTYNGEEWLNRCIGSLVNSTVDNHQIVVIDNGSSDKTCMLIRDFYPQVELVESDRNLGFGKANNIGIKKAMDAGADFVFLLNQDAWVEESTIEDLISVASGSAYGILSPMQLDVKGVIEKKFFKYLGKSTQNNDNRILDVPFVNAASWLMTASCIKTVGLFDSLFYHYGEDTNYCHRVYYYNFKVGIAKEVQVTHDRGDRVEKKSLRQLFYRKEIVAKGLLANINLKFGHLLVRYYFKAVVVLLKRIVQLRLKEFLTQLALLFQIILLLCKIKKSRQRASKNDYNLTV
jgi:GT2 family glycosyltransferase